jgi:hypothetical protein
MIVRLIGANNRPVGMELRSGQCPLSNGREQNVIGTSIRRKPLLFNGAYAR